jgi:zona occludens toxin
MLTLITGTPGAGKSLYSVWEIARKVPGSTVENGQEIVHLKLYSNVKNLLVEHEFIDGDDLNRWHEWAKPGDVILFDEVQEVWRPRSLGSKVPDCIAKLETHRHMGVDLILVTQHPMLLDPNIRRLVNQHIHMRRITKTVAMRYEWDHCENPGNTRTCVDSGVWFHPKKAYELYKSAQLHTKPTARMPKIAWLGLLALGGLAYAAPMAYDRLSHSMGKTQEVIASPVSVPGQTPAAPEIKDGYLVSTVTTTSSDLPPPVVPDVPPDDKPKVSGCIVSPAAKCKCFDTDGRSVPVEPDLCPSTQAKSGADLANLFERTYFTPVQEVQMVALGIGQSAASVQGK